MRMGQRTFNAKPILHFQPGHLNLRETRTQIMFFRHNSFNKRYSNKRADTNYHPDGFCCLFEPRIEPVMQTPLFDFMEELPRLAGPIEEALRAMP